MKAWLIAFALTQLVEVPIYLVATKRNLQVAFLASTFTHPIVWFVFPLVPIAYWPMVALAEAFAVVVEAAWLRVNRVSHPVRWSVIANASSVAVGLLIRALTGVV